MLVHRVDQLARRPELGQRQYRVLVNLTHALIRWYVRPESRDSPVTALLAIKHLDPVVDANLRLARWYWHTDLSEEDDEFIAVYERDGARHVRIRDRTPSGDNRVAG